jgi:hypothetical protein
MVGESMLKYSHLSYHRYLLSFCCIKDEVGDFSWMRDIRCVASVKRQSGSIHLYAGPLEVSYDLTEKFDIMLVIVSMLEDQMVQQSLIDGRASV